MDLTAINTQQILTYGESRSPMRAHFQKMPRKLEFMSAQPLLILVCWSEDWHRRRTETLTHPPLCLSMGPGKVACTYVDVHIRRSKTSSKEWKLNSAD